MSHLHRDRGRRHLQLVSFTIHGTNDAAVIGDPNVADVTRQFRDHPDGDR